MFVIVKKSRCWQKDHSYAGPTCASAGVEPGKLYETYEAAFDVAVRLSMCNPVGFDVVDNDTGKIVSQGIFEEVRKSKWKRRQSYG